MEALYKIMENMDIKYIDYPVASGKESVVFRAIMKNRAVAIKIFKISTIKFSTLDIYIQGDRRFEKERRDRSTRVTLWCRKEFTNLQAMREVGISAPIPYGHYQNVLVMQYLGTASRPAPQIKNYNGQMKRMFDLLMDDLRKMYQKAGLVHADLSEYNVLVYRNKPYIIDVGQMVDIGHPSAELFLKRDILNIVNFFRKKGIECKEEQIYGYIKGESIEPGN